MREIVDECAPVVGRLAPGVELRGRVEQCGHLRGIDSSRRPRNPSAHRGRESIIGGAAQCFRAKPRDLVLVVHALQLPSERRCEKMLLGDPVRGRCDEAHRGHEREALRVRRAGCKFSLGHRLDSGRFQNLGVVIRHFSRARQHRAAEPAVQRFHFIPDQPHQLAVDQLVVVLVGALRQIVQPHEARPGILSPLVRHPAGLPACDSRRREREIVRAGCDLRVVEHRIDHFDDRPVRTP